ncbi:MAG TPA: metallophosphoesterase [Actinomycetota bacterium]|nr:metallophosphoesterase [Actinomycetota bacterium]
MTARRPTVVVLLILAVACPSAPPEPRGPVTARERVRGPLPFAVIGDFGTGEEAQHVVADALRRVARERRIPVLVTTGDNVYEDGNPDDFDDAWHEPYGWVERRGIDVVASLGNHDLGTDDGVPVMELLGMPNPWYARRYGDVEFFVLDSGALGAPAQLRFVADAMRRSKAPWKIAVVHHAPYGCSKHGGNRVVRELAVPVLREAGADVVLAGHEHNYQRFPPFGGMTVVVSGGGGAELHDVGECPDGTPDPVAVIDDAHHFLIGVANERRLRIEAVTADGSVADRVVIRA